MALIGYYNLMWVTVVKEKIIMRREIIMLIMMNAQVLQFYLNMTFFFLKPSQSPLLLCNSLTGNALRPSFTSQTSDRFNQWLAEAQRTLVSSSILFQHVFLCMRGGVSYVVPLCKWGPWLMHSLWTRRGAKQGVVIQNELQVKSQ